MPPKMYIVCLDLEGVLIPEVWQEVAEKTSNKDLLVTTREIPNLGELFDFRLNILKKNNIRLQDIQNIILGMDPVPGALDFLNKIRQHCQVVILSDIFYEFYAPFAPKLGYPAIMCHSLGVDANGLINSFELRLQNQKQKAVEAFKSLNYTVIASGDSYNDLSMIQNADTGFFFKPPQVIKDEYPNVPIAENYENLWALISKAMEM